MAGSADRDATFVGLLLGADIGGTWTRAAVATTAGEVLAVSAGPAGNPNAVGLEVAAARIRTAVARCLAQAGPGAPERLRAAVIGLAGASRTDSAFVASVLPAGVDPRPRLVSDLSVAFSSATAAPEGYVLVAGTGAVAGRIAHGELRERRDGWGWLLGDEGSGFWVGREVVRATLAALQGGRPLGPLGAAVVDRIGTPDPVAIVQRCYDEPPIWLAGFAALVSGHADDPASTVIAEQAAAHLHRTLLDLDLRPDLPVVLAGSVVTRPGPVRSALTRRLDGTCTNPVLTAASGLVGALWLAAREIGASDEVVHRTLGVSAARTSGTLV